MDWQCGGFEPLGEERDWQDENPWQAALSEKVAALRNRAEFAFAAELAEMLHGLSERYDRPAERVQR